MDGFYERQLDSMVSELYATYEPDIDFKFPLHFHHCFEIIYVINGNIKADVNNKTYYLHEGDVIIVLPYEIHSFVSLGQTKIRILIANPYFYDTIMNIFNGKQLLNHVSNFIGTDILKYYHLIYHAYYKNKDFLEAKGYTYILFSKLLKKLKFVPSDKVQHYDKLSLICEILKYIDSNYYNNISINDIINHFALNKSYVMNIFKDKIGTTFHQYLNKERVFKSLNLLKNTELSITDIAYETGFDNQRTFNRLFKKYINLTPSEYKSKICAQNSEWMDRV